MARDRLASRVSDNLGTSDIPQPQLTVQPQVTHNDGGAPPSQGYQGGRYEMSEVPSSSGDGDDMSAFYSEISSIQDSLRTLNDNVSRISDIHSRSLSTMDEAAAQRNASQIDELAEETNMLSNQLKERIKNLQKKRSSGRDGQIRQQQTDLVKRKFLEAIQNYQQVEQQYRAKYKQRVERQFKIVKPDATPEEVKAVVDDEQGGQIFAQALQSSDRYGESRVAFREAQERQEDIRRIERTLGELAQLFNEIALLVEKDEETIDNIQTTATIVEGDTETGLKHTDKAVKSARAARRKRWICFIIVLIILAIIGIVVGVVVGGKQ